MDTKAWHYLEVRRISYTGVWEAELQSREDAEHEVNDPGTRPHPYEELETTANVYLYSINAREQMTFNGTLRLVALLA